MARQMLMDNVYLTYIPSEKFKTSFFSAQMVMPLKKETAGLNALMVNVLSRGTLRFPDMRSLSAQLDRLYGARLEPVVRKKGEKLFLILADEIEDPHNLGAIIRTANLAGAHGVIIPKRRAVGLTATVAKTSAGALNYTPVAKVTNLVKTMEELKEKGLWFVCADMDGEQMYDLNLTGPIGLVIGNEGEGVGRLVKENCDFVAGIPMKGQINSLNASVAAGVLAYEIVRQRISQK